VTDAPRRLIRVGEILPSLVLTGADGPVTLPPSGPQSSLLVVAHHRPCAGCSSYLTEVAGVVDDLQAWATRAVGVGPSDAVAASLPFPFPVLGDEGGGARRRLGLADDEAAVVLADRWGEVVEVAAFGADHGFPLPSQLVESAKIIDLSCGECNVPGPEWRNLEP